MMGRSPGIKFPFFYQARHLAVFLIFAISPGFTELLVSTAVLITPPH
jgi:hypothetical protein